MKTVRVLLVLLCLICVGCQPVLVALGEGPTLEPTATSTWPAPATTTPTVVPPTPFPTPTATATHTPSPTATPSPTVPSTPFPTPTATPTPAAGYYGDSAIGFSVSYPSDWETEERRDGLRIRSTDPWVWVYAESELLGEDETVEDYVRDMYELFDDVDAVRVLTDTTVLLWDGTEARMLEFSEPDSEHLARITLLSRGRRVFSVLIAAPHEVFDDYPQTLEAIAASMRVEEPKPYGIPRDSAMFMSGSQPYSIDPALTHSGAGGWIGCIFSGLVMLDENLQVVPDLAERWVVNEDGTVYTFYLRQHAVFHDGTPVTAHDVKFSWERAADPETESDTVEVYLGDIVGAKDKRQGKADGISGVKVIDDHTLEVTIDTPKVYFLAKLTYPTSFVVDERNVQDEDWEHHPNGTGPFRLAVWEDDHLFILERNDAFYLEPPKLEHLVYLLDAGISMWLYENGEIDRVGVGASNIERVTDPSNPLNADLRIGPALCTSRLVFDVTMPPFDDPLVRQAFAYAVDRQKLNEVVLKGMEKPAYTILPPGMPGYSADIVAPSHDPDKARELLEASSYGSADALPEITLTIRGWGGGLSDYYSALVEMWRTHLGIEVTVEQLEPPSYAFKVRESHGQMLSWGWCADYPDPENFLDVLYHSDSQENLGQYSNVGVDDLLEQARVERDVEARMALYHRIEQMIVDDAPDILLDQGQSHVLVKPYVKDYTISPISLALRWRVVYVERPSE